jgi:membrane protease subunit HflK
VLALWLAFSTYYQVEPDEVGLLLRFGRYVGTSDPGPHFKAPFGIDHVLKVPVQRQLKMEFGFRTSRADVQSEFVRPESARPEAEMLTGDLNVAIVEWIVQYKINDPEKYVFNFRDVHATLRLMSEAALRSVVGDHSIDEVLTSGRAAIEDQAKKLLQELNERYDTGITVQQLKLQDVNAPESVRPAFREVEEAKQERERAVNDAWADYNKIIPQARGQAEQALQSAEGYAVERVNRARGEATRFRALVAEYKKAPQVTRTRLYLEAMQEILPQAKRQIIVDSEARAFVPLLNLDARDAREGGK